jgi:hypothetical protein
MITVQCLQNEIMQYIITVHKVHFTYIKKFTAVYSTHYEIHYTTQLKQSSINITTLLYTVHMNRNTELIFRV